MLGDVAVEGNAELPGSRVARLSKLKIGELLTPKALKGAEDNLMKSAVFDQARADAIGKGTPRTVRLTVDERLWRSFSGAVKWSLQDGYAIEGGMGASQYLRRRRAAARVGHLWQPAPGRRRELSGV